MRFELSNWADSASMLGQCLVFPISCPQHSLMADGVRVGTKTLNRVVEMELSCKHEEKRTGN